MRTIANPTTPGLAMIIPALWATQCEYWLSLAPATLEGGSALLGSRLLGSRRPSGLKSRRWPLARAGEVIV
jgi:hypothetical protein